MQNTRGLYSKYKIVNRETGQEVQAAFVLKPEVDYSALKALLAYAEDVRRDNPRLAEDLINWHDRIIENMNRMFRDD